LTRTSFPYSTLPTPPRARILRVDREDFVAIALDRRHAEPVTQHDDREPERRKLQKLRKLHHRRVTSGATGPEIVT
jgi:hypothetical protein